MAAESRNLSDWESFWDLESPQEEAARKADYDFWIEVLRSIKGDSSRHDLPEDTSPRDDSPLFETVLWMRGRFGGAARRMAIDFAKAAVQQGKKAERDFWVRVAKLLVGEIYIVLEDG